jgi:hypothetical protein
MRRFRQWVAIQAATDVQDDEGGVSYSYADIPGKERVPATIMRTFAEDKVSTMTPVTDRYRIVIAGHHPYITPKMRVFEPVSGEGFDILEMSQTLGRRATVLMAHKVEI